MNQWEGCNYFVLKLAHFSLVHKSSQSREIFVDECVGKWTLFLASVLECVCLLFVCYLCVVVVFFKMLWYCLDVYMHATLYCVFFGHFLNVI